MTPVDPESETQAGLVQVDGLDELDEDLEHGMYLEGDDDGSGEVVVASSEENSGTSKILAELENLMMEEEFNTKVEAFTQQHCEQFEEGEENKLIYTSLFSEYTKMIEAFIEARLSATLKGFDMHAFCASLSARSDKEELPLALEMLSAYGDFQSFKEMMLSCKLGARVGDMGVVGSPVRVFSEEQEDGEAMPDLNLSISGLGGGA